MTAPNDITLFSNGIGHFRRYFTIKDPQKISIPFKRDHIGDVAASLQVFGEVKLDSPPSFTPMNAGKTALSINRSEALLSLLKNLSGAEITIGSNGLIYTLVGVDRIQLPAMIDDSEEAYRDVVVVSTPEGVQHFQISNLSTINFVNESVRSEIHKALNKNYQKIKPDSTFLDLTLSSLNNKEVEAQIQYTIPLAAWKMRYSIRQNKDKFVLEGSAIIDNNTDEDWDNFIISVVTGNPVSFATDIAEVVLPERKLVKLVDDIVPMNYEPEQGRSVAIQAQSLNLNRNVYRSSKLSLSNTADFGMESSPEETYYTSHGLAVVSPGVESKDVGDFCVFKAKEAITVLARRSAIVPMFSVPLKTAGMALLYQAKRNECRPYRTIKFKNETEFSLGRGKTIIYNEGVFSGECILDNTKPGENRVLPHCLENGVRIIRTIEPRTTLRKMLKISNGMSIQEYMQVVTTSYVIENKKKEAFKVLLEHNYELTSPVVEVSGVDIKESEVITDGSRYYFDLNPLEKVTLLVKETYCYAVEANLGDNYTFKNIVSSNDTAQKLMEDKNVLTCLSIQKEIDKIEEQINAAKEELVEYKEQMDRTRSNITASKDVRVSSNVIEDWVKDLSETETLVRELNKRTIPNLKRQQEEAEDKLHAAFAEISFLWNGAQQV